MSSKKLFLIDGSGYIFRAFHALPPLNRKRDGVPTGAVLGFVNMINKLISENFLSEKGSHIAIIFDKGSKTFRNEIYKDYKANRGETPEDLIPQFDLIRKAAISFNLSVIEKEGFEADDIIATFAKKAVIQGFDVIVVSSDKDLMQLVNQNVSMLDPMKNKKITETEVLEKFGVLPNKVIDVQALAGDSSDNVPGVPGIGIKTAAQLINEFGNLDLLLKNTNKIKQPKRRQSLVDYESDARLSLELVTLKDDVEIDTKINDLSFSDPDNKIVKEFLEDMEFNNLIKRLNIDERLDEPVANESVNLEILQNIEQLDEWVKKSKDAGACAVSFIDESSVNNEDYIMWFSISYEKNKVAFISVGNNNKENFSNKKSSSCSKIINFEKFKKIVKPLFEDPSILKIFHDAKQSMHVLKKLDISLVSFDDIMVMSYSFAGGVHSHDFETLAEKYLDESFVSIVDCVGTGKKILDFSEVGEEKLLRFLAGRTKIIFKLWEIFKHKIIEHGSKGVYEVIDKPLIKVLFDIEEYGIELDTKVLKNLSQNFHARISALSIEIYKLAGKQFNIGSPKQLGEILFEDMGLSGGKKGKGGSWGTNIDVLEDLAGQGVELAQRVIDWRQLSKLTNTYVDKLPAEVNSQTKRVHSNFELAITNTGRLSSSDPNLQNIPIRTEDGRMIRTAFVAAKGYKLLCADYSQIELRLLAHMGDIPQLNEAFKNGIDIHSMTASEVFEIPIDKMTSSIRRKAKAINFGIIYGISAFGLAKQLSIQNAEAKKYIESYFKRFPGIKNYMDLQKKTCKEKGYVETFFGRRIHLPGINDKNSFRRSFAERQAINAPLQGAAADIIKRAMAKIEKQIRIFDSSSRMLLQVHDELIFEVLDSDIKKVSKMVKSTMEQVVDLTVPLEVTLGVGKNWEEAH